MAHAASPSGPAPGTASSTPRFTHRERCELFAVGGWMTSLQVVSFAFVLESGRLALLGAGVAAVFFAVHAHFAGASVEPDLGPPTGMTGADLDRLIDAVDRRQGVLLEAPAGRRRRWAPVTTTSSRSSFATRSTSCPTSCGRSCPT